MNKHDKTVPHTVKLTDLITPKSCSIYIAELIKYIIFTKQQIPYPYERLKMYVMKRRERQKLIELQNNIRESDGSERVSFFMEKHYKKVEEAFEILDSTFKCIEYELTKSSEHPLEEVVLLFGATPLSPKDVYRFKIPSLSYGHSESQHLYKRQIGNLFRGIIISDEVNASLQRNIGLTNMFVMVKLRKGGSADTQWLLPQDCYRPSQRAQQVCFTLESTGAHSCTCNCAQPDLLGVLSDGMAALSVSGGDSESDDQCVWYQMQRTLKGFRDSKSQGKSVTDLWYKHSFLS
uniref:Uncharacterized protein n=1 Tax=Graphocephala atropunctata TaxID=36148 RepID=A0A1B6M2I9_9HEMI